MLLNGVFWGCFLIYFIHAAKLDDPRFCMDHCHPAYAFWGHGVGYNANPFSFPFMRVMATIHLPSYVVTKLAENALTGEPMGRLLSGVYFPGNPNLSGGVVFFGISLDGYQLLFTMLLSFVQWFLIVKSLAWLTRRSARANLYQKEG